MSRWEDTPVGETVMLAVGWEGVTSDVTEDAVDVGQLTTDELVPDDAVHLSGVRTYRVRDGIAPLAVVD